MRGLNIYVVNVPCNTIMTFNWGNILECWGINYYTILISSIYIYIYTHMYVANK